MDLAPIAGILPTPSVAGLDAIDALRADQPGSPSYSSR
jgi:hypothetical protein